MNDTPDAIDEAKEFENLVLFSHRLNALLRKSPLFSDGGLSVAGFSFLVALAKEPSTLNKAAAKASVFDKDEQRALRSELLEAGLVREVTVDGGRKGLALSEAGSTALDTLRAKFAETAKSAQVKSWKAVPRFASIVRSLRQPLSAGGAETA